MITLIYSIYNDTHCKLFAITKAFPTESMNVLLFHDDVDKEQIDFKQIHLLTLLSTVLLFLLEMCWRLNSVLLCFLLFIYRRRIVGLFRLA